MASISFHVPAFAFVLSGLLSLPLGFITLRYLLRLWLPDIRTHLDAEHIARFKITTVPTGRSVFRAFLARALGHAEFVGDHFVSGARDRLLLV